MSRRWKNRPEGSNWGDFGDDDQIGRLNLITPEIRRAALAEAKEGIAFALSLPLDIPAGEAISPHRKPPRSFAVEIHEGQETVSGFHRCMSRYSPFFCDVVNDDAVTLYTQYSTQWDSLAHVGQEFDADGDGVAEMVFYNGFRADEDIRAPSGQNGAAARALGIDRMAATAVQGRGVLVDLHEAYGDAHERVGYDALMDVMRRQGAEIRAGDILCLHTGFADIVLRQGAQPDAKVLRRSSVGLDGSDERLLDWITSSGIAAICADNPAVEYVSPRPRSQEPHPLLPLHAHCLFKQGIHLGELWNLGDLAGWLKARGRSSFLLTAPPLNLPGTMGSPVTPVATV
jgi:kynurenine formamidase